MAATHRAVKNSSMTNDAVSVPASSTTKTLGSISPTVAQVSTYIDSSVTATIVAVPDSNNTTSVVSVVTLSAPSTGTTSIHESVTSASIVAPQPSGIITTSFAATMAPTMSHSTSTPSSRSQTAPSATNTTQPVATATTTNMASYTSQSLGESGASSQSAVPSLETSSAISPGVLASRAGNVTGSASPQPPTTTVASSNGMREQSHKG